MKATPPGVLVCCVPCPLSLPPSARMSTRPPFPISLLSVTTPIDHFLLPLFTQSVLALAVNQELDDRTICSRDRGLTGYILVMMSQPPFLTISITAIMVTQTQCVCSSGLHAPLRSVAILFPFGWLPLVFLDNMVKKIQIRIIKE